MISIRASISTVLLLLVFSFTTQSDTLFDNQFRERVKQAQAGNKRAQYKLGNAYLMGSQVKVDVSRAIYWLQKSARQNYVKAMYKLGVIYYSNRAVRSQRSKAFRWFTKAAGFKHARAAYYLGLIYHEGAIVPKDAERALHWLNLSVHYGYEDAKKLRQRILASKKPSKPRSPKRVTRVSKAANPIRPKRTAPTPAIPIKPTTKFRNPRMLVLKGNWTIAGRSAAHMPSERNKCIPNGTKIKCKSNTIVRSNDLYNAHLEIESEISEFSPRGTFSIKYRTNYLMVNPRVKITAEDEVPKLGWQKSVSRLRCRLIAKNMIKCYSDDLRVERYYNKPSTN